MTILETTTPMSDEPGIIPFADETELVQSRADEQRGVQAQDLGESAADEFGAVNEPQERRSVVDHDLDLNGRTELAMRGRYSCPCCGEGARRVMRVRVVTQPRWVAVCAVCAASMLAQIPGTIVGGMVRPTRRRRPMRVQASGGGRAEGQPGFRGRQGTRYRRAS